MKIGNTTWFLLSMLTVLLFALPLQAGDLTFFVGGVNPGTITYKDVKTDLDGSPIYGARLGMNFVPYFGMEHTLAFSSDFLFPHNVAGITEAKGFVYNSNLIFNMPFRKTIPYFTVGAGLIHQYGDSDMPVGTKFAFNYGGGLKFPRLAGPLGLRFDMRGYRAGTISNKLNMLEISGGLLISFGK
ncbi:MAG TPA: outer membrane beta-barrel protein [Acidobacteriota bacterium]|nr:outer membrane beta-barrel protein [Acidobacteriota bacterium]